MHKNDFLSCPEFHETVQSPEMLLQSVCEGSNWCHNFCRSWRPTEVMAPHLPRSRKCRPRWRRNSKRDAWTGKKMWAEFNLTWKWFQRENTAEDTMKKNRWGKKSIPKFSSCLRCFFILENYITANCENFLYSVMIEHPTTKNLCRLMHKRISVVPSSLLPIHLD